jgi:hypothetical protein
VVREALGGQRAKRFGHRLLPISKAEPVYKLFAVAILARETAAAVLLADGSATHHQELAEVGKAGDRIPNTQ